MSVRQLAKAKERVRKRCEQVCALCARGLASPQWTRRIVSMKGAERINLFLKVLCRRRCGDDWFHSMFRVSRFGFATTHRDQLGHAQLVVVQIAPCARCSGRDPPFEKPDMNLDNLIWKIAKLKCQAFDSGRALLVRQAWISYHSFGSEIWYLQHLGSHQLPMTTNLWEAINCR